MPEDTDTQPTETEAPQPAPAFTQADIDRIVKERIERVKAKYADYDDLKARAARLDEIECSQMDEGMTHSLAVLDVAHTRSTRVWARCSRSSAQGMEEQGSPVSRPAVT
jgi:hypothetical protein